MSKKRHYKYIGYHNQKKVVSTFGSDKLYAEAKCKELLLGYFHEITPGLTKLPLESYNGVVAYIGETNVDDRFHPNIEYFYSKKIS